MGRARGWGRGGPSGLTAFSEQKSLRIHSRRCSGREETVENRLVIAKGVEGGGGRKDGEFKIKRQTITCRIDKQGPMV